MNVITHIRHVSHSDGLEEQLESWARSQFKFHDHGNLKINVYVSKASPRREAHGASFECHMTAKMDRNPRIAFAKLVDHDFWGAVSGCAERLQHQLERDEGRQARRRYAG